MIRENSVNFKLFGIMAFADEFSDKLRRSESQTGRKE